MPELELSPAAQQWVNVVLIWVGFGTLSGLLAMLVLPMLIKEWQLIGNLRESINVPCEQSYRWADAMMRASGRK